MSSPLEHDLGEVIGRFAGVRGGLLPALHAVQEHRGFIAREDLDTLADVFNLSVSEVHGVVSFYDDFRTEAPVGPVVRVCRGEACMARGAARVIEAASQLHGDSGLEVGGFEVVGFEVGEVSCVGNCALGPNLLVEGVVVPVRGASDIAAAVRRAQHLAATNVTAGSAVVADGAPTVYVPSDSSARGAGAEAVAAAFAASGWNVVRNGSRGMAWLEPLVEFEHDGRRVGYGPVGVDDVAGLVAALPAGGRDHPLHLGPIDDLAWMKGQHRVTSARFGVVEPASCRSYVDHGGLVGLRRALSMSPGEVVDEVSESGLRGRGGAAFPTGVKLRTVAATDADEKFVVVNADEGDAGAFADRMVMEADPFQLLEGMLIAAHATGATSGYVYVRSEYPDAVRTMNAAVAAANDEGWLGDDALGAGRPFRVEIRVGAGSYICGEETALLESIEGRRGIVRAKPPIPAHAGLWGRPTFISNVLTVAALASVLADGAAAYAALGTGRSRGTQVVQLAGDVACGGLVEVPFGTSLHELVHNFGGGTASGRPVRAVQVGGPLGAYLPADGLDLPLDYEAFAAAGAMLGHGSVVVFADDVDMAEMARAAMEFCAAESCGKCTPCRIGSTRGVELLDRVIAGEDRERHLALLGDLCDVMADASLCAMGGLTPLPVRSALRYFPEDFGAQAGEVAR